MALAGLVVTAAAATLSTTSTAQLAIGAGDTVVTQLDEGALMAVAATGETTTVATGLGDPHGTVVLDDGSILIADPTAGQILGVLGRFGDEPTPVADLEGVEALTVAPDGRVFATARVPGEVAQIDVDTGTAETVASGLSQPYGIAAIDEGLVVVESGAARVSAVDPDTGATNLLVQEDSGLLIGVAVAPDRSLYVSDFNDGEIIHFVFGAREVVATIDGPALLSLAPATDAAEEELVVAAYDEDALVRLTLDGAEVDRTPVDGPFGAAVAPDAVAPPVSSTTEAPATTEPGGAGTTGAGAADADESDDSNAGLLVLGAGVVAIVVVGAGLWLFARRRARDDGGGARGTEPPFSSPEPPARRSVAPTFEGSCADERRAVADAETALAAAEAAVRDRELRLDSTQTALELATRAAREADRQLSLTDHAVMEARTALGISQEAVNSAAEGLAVAKERDSQSPAWRIEDLSLSEAGSQALAAFRAGEIGPSQLKIRWMASGDGAAIEQLTEVGQGHVPSARGATAEVERATSELGRARARVAQAESRYRKAQSVAQQARADLAEAMRASDDARHEEDRLASQIEQTTERLEVVRERLRACREQARRNAVQEARREAAERDAAEKAAIEERLIAGLED